MGNKHKGQVALSWTDNYTKCTTYTRWVTKMATIFSALATDSWGLVANLATTFKSSCWALCLLVLSWLPSNNFQLVHICLNAHSVKWTFIWMLWGDYLSSWMGLGWMGFLLFPLHFYLHTRIQQSSLEQKELPPHFMVWDHPQEKRKDKQN